MTSIQARRHGNGASTRSLLPRPSWLGDSLERGNKNVHVVGSEGDIFEPNQVVKARERLGDHGLDIRMLPGGHMITSEQPEQLARIIEEVGPSMATG